MSNVLTFTEDDVNDLYDVYKRALKQGMSNEDSFTFRGADFNVAYARYQLEYLKSRFPNSAVDLKKLDEMHHLNRSRSKKDA